MPFFKKQEDTSPKRPQLPVAQADISVGLSLAEVEERCAAMEAETKEKCDRMVAEAELKAQACWDNCSAKIKQLVDSFEGLQQAIDVYSAIHHKPSEPTSQIYGRMY